MNILIDTNVLLDFIQHREHFSASEQLLTLCAKREVHGFMAAHSVPNMFYVLRKDFSDEERREILLALVELIPVVNIDHEMIEVALKRKKFSDFEDCLQVECAKKIAADYIITRNVTDYTESEVKAFLPNEFLDKIVSEKSLN